MEFSHSEEAIYFYNNKFRKLVEAESLDHELEYCEIDKLDFSLEGSVLSKNGTLTLVLPIHDDI